MARCIVCGRRLTSEKSISCGIGSECRSKSHKAGTTNKRGNRWRRRVERTSGFAKGEFEISNTRYTRIENEFPITWQDGKHLYDEFSLFEWLEQNKQIVLPNEVPDKIYVLLKQGLTVEEILDKTMEV